MNKILVPTDFSQVAQNATMFACEIATRNNSAVVLLHTYMVPLVSSEIPVYVDNTVIEELRKSAVEKLIEQKEKLIKIFPNLIIHYILEEGDVAFRVEDLLSKKEYDLVVMGTTGAGNIEGFLIGSNTYDVIKGSNIPVLCVPKNAIFNGISKMAYGTNCKNEDFYSMKQYIEIAALFNAQVTIVHLEQKGEDEDELINWFETEAKKNLKYEKLSFRMFPVKDTFQDMNNYLKTHHYSILALHKRTPSFIESIFKPSLSQKFAFHSDIPLMVYK